ncbi:carboxypeptidase-like regulatory domain-containing protein [Hymenobacter sp. GOD-10R]|uniref:carboxypeptidase-like regulatory domain-containing protein n=1 Tax=Hymenobacter sp. GOD-10R TaxID=3093922 RepID=UPI002D79BAA0|nr:carboxypeptidase-like regulatory domain-containing protein [Hymenobacter sp. GOD-10R]WRQ26656.1 carboxypeptidase-like regulatory domain-containing protein [Hymenobacter sp. GOD-10R]
MKIFVSHLIILLWSLVALTTKAQAQQEPREVTGTVLNNMGQPLAGASVTVVGEKNGAVSTNSAGGFVIRTAAEKPMIHVSYAGYDEDEQQMLGTEPLTFSLNPINKYKKQLKKRSKAAQKAWKH